METKDLITALRASAKEIPDLMKIKEGMHNPHIKAWKTKVAELLQAGGSTCRKPLELLGRMKNQMGSSELVNRQTFLNQMEVLGKTIEQTVQTLTVFGRPEDKDVLPHWGKPKSQQRAVGHLMVGDEEIVSNDISIHEVLDCLVSLTEDSNDLSEQMRDKIIGHLRAILDDDLLQPFLSRGMDVLLGHWPEFQSKE